ncbi:MAG: hypothetical protein AB7S75_15035 [Desulfococcaceae bacterium]
MKKMKIAGIILFVFLIPVVSYSITPLPVPFVTEGSEGLHFEKWHGLFRTLPGVKSKLVTEETVPEGNGMFVQVMQTTGGMFAGFSEDGTELIIPESGNNMHWLENTQKINGMNFLNPGTGLDYSEYSVFAVFPQDQGMMRILGSNKYVCEYSTPGWTMEDAGVETLPLTRFGEKIPGLIFFSFIPDWSDYGTVWLMKGTYISPSPDENPETEFWTEENKRQNPNIVRYLTDRNGNLFSGVVWKMKIGQWPSETWYYSRSRPFMFSTHYVNPGNHRPSDNIPNHNPIDRFQYHALTMSFRHLPPEVLKTGSDIPVIYHITDRVRINGQTVDRTWLMIVDKSRLEDEYFAVSRWGTSKIFFTKAEDVRINTSMFPNSEVCPAYIFTLRENSEEVAKIVEKARDFIVERYKVASDEVQIVYHTSDKIFWLHPYLLLGTEYQEN